jgi:thiamine-phosphate pyrophosphorylase
MSGRPMVAQLFLVTPQEAEPAAFAATLARVVANADIAALLVCRHDRDAETYRRLVEAVLPVAQAAGCAVIVEDDAALARETAADGVHVTGGLRSVRETVALAKPGLIVGAGPVATRHEAMSIGELDVDYIFFGDLAAPASEQSRDLAAWWAQTFEVPAVLSGDADADAAGCEFLALGEALWSGAEPPEVLAAKAMKSLETA